MKKPNYLVKINEPCHENWENMTPSKQGKFCGSCAKNVIDFSKMSDKEIINILEENSDNLCGRFQKKQLNRTILYENKTNNFTKFYQILSGLLFFSFAESTAETLKPRTSISPTTHTSENKDSLKMPPKNDTLKGKILDKKGDAIPGVNITIKNTTLATISLDDGTFAIIIPNTLIMNSLVVEFNAIMFNSLSIEIQSQRNLNVTLTMSEDSEIAGGISVRVVHKPWQKGWWKGYSWRNRWNKVKNVFRKN